MSVIFDGVNTTHFRPNPNVTLRLTTHQNRTVQLTRQTEVITFCNRNLEPYRGYHIFMRALPELLRRRPHARVIVVGGNGVSYGAAPNAQRYPNATSWKEIFRQEVESQITPQDWERVHFVGKVEPDDFRTLLQLSTVHVYLTYPFVLSWSVLECMACGCAIVGSDTVPVREMIRHNETGRLFPFFEPHALVEQVVDLLEHPDVREELGAAARRWVVAKYDLETVSLPQQLLWVNRLGQVDPGFGAPEW